MGIFSKLAFWKKDEDLGLGKDVGADLGLGPPNQQMAPDLGLPNYQPGMQRNTGLDQNMNLGIPDDTGFGSMGRPPSSMQPPGQPSPMQQPFGAPMQPQQPTERDYKNDKFELVSAKLDSIRYTLDTINQRLANLERIAHSDTEKKKGW